MKTGLVFFAVAILVSSVFGDDEDKSLTLHKKMIARRREVNKQFLNSSFNFIL